MILDFRCNGKAVQIETPADSRALDVIRDGLGLTGTKEGCGRGECGACTILLDGNPVNACLLYAAKLLGREVTTIEGVAAADGSLHPLQEAFLAEGAVQCGYCTPGMILSAKALLDRRPDPEVAEIEEALSGNFCRCTGYGKIVAAVRRAAAIAIHGYSGTSPSVAPAAAIAGLRLRSRSAGPPAGYAPSRGPTGGTSDASGSAAASPDLRLPRRGRREAGMGTESLRVVGRRVGKVDGPELVTGRARFAGDLRFPGMLHACARRAGVPAGKLLSVDPGPALAVPGVRAVLLPRDIPGANLIGILPPFDQPLLAGQEIRYEGESLALVVAENREAARTGAAAVRARIDAWEPVLDPEEALREGCRRIHPQGNLTFAKKLRKGDTAKGFARSEVVIEGTYETSFQEHAYLEPEAVVAVPESDGRITVYASCQSPFHLRGHIAANLALPASRVRVVQAFTGGSFGGKDDVATEIGSLAAIAAVRCADPVAIVHDREESIIGSNLRHAARIRCRTGAMRDGTLVAREVQILLDGGAYASESPFVTMKALIHACGPYHVPHVAVDCRTAYTNKTYCGAFRGFGVPQVTFATESQLDELAARLGLDPLELRRRNALRPGLANATGQVFQQSVGLPETIARVEERRPPDRRPPEAQDRWLYGQGVACLLQGISNGAEGIDVVGASVQVGQDGSVLVGVGLTEMGQGSRTVYAQIAAEVLGVSLQQVAVRPVDTDAVHDSGPTVASRSTTVGGMAVLKAAQEVRGSLLRMASLLFKAPEEQIQLMDDSAVLGIPGAPRIPLREVATAAYWTGLPLMHLAFSRAPDARFDHETHQGDIYIAYNYGTHLMDVRVDRYTGRVEVLRHLAAHDVGKAINPGGVEGQVEGGALIGYGLAHLERIESEGGHILNANFSDYALPSIKDRLPTETIVVEDPNPTGPYGAKGVGEPPVAGAAAAFANAVAAATGVRFHRLPITREDILVAIQGPAVGSKGGGRPCRSF